MRRLGLACCVLLTLVAGCPSQSAYDCPGEGEYVESGVGRYCAYGVVIGGFDCPSDLPNRFEFPSEDPSIPAGFVCSDRPFGSRDDVPMAVCDRIPACRPRVDAGSMEIGDTGAPDGGTGDTGFGDSGSDTDARATSACEAIGGTCTLPGGPPSFTVSCPMGLAAISGSETGLGGYRQLGCGSVEAGPLACCVPTFDCDGDACPVTSICVRRSGPAPGVITCEERPAACSDAMDCSPPCTAEADCITAVCGGFLDSASIDGTRFECPGS